MDISTIHVDFLIETKHLRNINRPDLVVVEMVYYLCSIVDVAYPFNTRMVEREGENSLSMEKER